MGASSVLAEKRRRALAPAKWVRPVRGYPSGTPFGARGSHWASGRHTGLDFPAPTGTPIYAVAAGRVASVGKAGAYGNRVVLTHSPGLQTWYCHLSAFNVTTGQQVAAGDVLGAVGDTGNTTGPHLHLEVRRDGVAVDPAPYLSGAADAASSDDYDSGAQPAGVTTNAALVASADSSRGGITAEARRLAVVMATIAGGVALVAVGVAKATEPKKGPA